MIIILERQDKKVPDVKVSWIYPPLINIQNFKDKAKDYQVRHVLDAVDKLEEEK